MEIEISGNKLGYAYLDLLLNRSNRRENESETVRSLVVATVLHTATLFVDVHVRDEEKALSSREKLSIRAAVQVRKENPSARLDNYSIMNSVRQCCPSIIGNNRHVVRVDAS